MIGFAEIGHDTFNVLRAVMHHTEATTGKFGIAAAFCFRRALKQRDGRSTLNSGQRRAQRGVSSADHHNVERLIAHRLFPEI